MRRNYKPLDFSEPLGLEIDERSPYRYQVGLLQSRIKDDFVIQVLIVLPEHPQIGIGIIATAETGNNSGTACSSKIWTIHHGCNGSKYIMSVPPKGVYFKAGSTTELGIHPIRDSADQEGDFVPP
jgi:hypothetical protein